MYTGTYAVSSMSELIFFRKIILHQNNMPLCNARAHVLRLEKGENSNGDKIQI